MIISFIKKLFGFGDKSTSTTTDSSKKPEPSESKKEQPQKKSHSKNNRNKNNRSNNRGRNNRNRSRDVDDSVELPFDPDRKIEVEPLVDDWTPDAETLKRAKEAEGTSFYSLGLPNPILRGINELGFLHCTDIQAQVLPHSLEGHDVTGKAQTGTGKTAAFLISIFNHILNRPFTYYRPGRPRALILAPTRELALQIGKDAKNLGKFTGCKAVSIIGGVDFEKQQNELNNRIDILVATPGRLIDYYRRKIIDLSAVEFFVLDEADRMLDMGFVPDVRRITAQMPPKHKRITQLYSATLNSTVLNLARQWLRDEYKTVEIEPESIVNTDVEQITYSIMSDKKLAVALWYLQNDNVERMIIFSNRKDQATRLYENLYRYGIDGELMTGDVPQKKRLSLLERFRKGDTKLIIATDVAGRGIHVDNVTHVINYDLPTDPEDYVHRIGRTGRAGSKGKSISFACEHSAFDLPAIEEYIEMQLKCTYPEDEMLELPEKVREYKRPQKSGGQGGNNRRRSSHHKRNDNYHKRDHSKGGSKRH